MCCIRQLYTCQTKPSFAYFSWNPDKTRISSVLRQYDRTAASSPNPACVYVPRVIKTQDPANLSLLSFGEVFALLFDNHFLYVMDLRTEDISGRWPLPAYRKSKRGSSFLAGVTSWLNGLDGDNDSGLVFATSMPDHSIHLVLWKENG